MFPQTVRFTEPTAAIILGILAAWVAKVSVVLSFQAQRTQMLSSSALRVWRKVKGREMCSRAGVPHMDP